MTSYRGETGFRHGEIPGVGLLVTNLGTPEAPTAGALRPYLREFLSDPRVIELPRLLWWAILNLFILPRRPRQSARLYAEVWTEEGSPLLATTRRIAAALEAALGPRVGSPLAVAVGMRYGRPAIADALDELRRKGCRRILVLPLYPQYSATTVGSTFDAVAAELTRWRWVPELRTIHSYHDEPGYVAALTASIREAWGEREPEKLLFSFHGIPLRYFQAGDPYHCLCHKTARLVAEELGIGEDRYTVSFQSLFGKEEWIKPYTDQTVMALARSGLGSLDVICPGFAADCLETLEEIDGLNRRLWVEKGGRSEAFRYIRALNDRRDHTDFLADLVQRHLQGWTVPPAEWRTDAAEEQAKASRRRAEALRSRPVRADGGFGVGSA